MGLPRLACLTVSDQDRERWESVKPAIYSLYKVELTEGVMGMSNTSKGKHSHRSDINWRPEGTQK